LGYTPVVTKDYVKQLVGNLADQLAGLPEDPIWKLRPEVLLCANTVKPMHGVVPRVILGKEWWDQTRQAAYRSTGYHCVACGVYKLAAKEYRWLEGHELYKTNYRLGRMTYVETVPLCHYCHCFIHDGRLQALRDKREITVEKYDAVMAHGKRVLAMAGIKKNRPYSGPMAEWQDWRLVLFGKEYPPLYKDYQAWLKAFSGKAVEAEG